MVSAIDLCNCTVSLRTGSVISLESLVIHLIFIRIPRGSQLTIYTHSHVWSSSVYRSAQTRVRSSDIYWQRLLFSRENIYFLLRIKFVLPRQKNTYFVILGKYRVFTNDKYNFENSQTCYYLRFGSQIRLILWKNHNVFYHKMFGKTFTI